MTRSRLFALVLLCLGVLAVGAPPVHAGSYEVKFCDAISASATPASPDGRGFVFTASSAAMANGPVQCPTNGDAARGMAQRNTLNRGLAAWLDHAAATFNAPPGAVIRSLKWRGMMNRTDCHWTVGLVANNAVRAGLSANQDCGVNSFNWGVEFTWDINASTFAFIAACGNFGGCDTAYDSYAPAPGARALMRTYSARILVEDASAPGFANVAGGLTGGGWVRGSQQFNADAVDNVGVASARFIVDGNLIRQEQVACDYALPRPCPSPRPSQYEVNTATLPEGEHRAAISVTDTAGNAGSVERTFLVDNTAPARPESVAVAGGEGWRTSNSFDVSWTNPPNQMAPIVAAHYSVCPAASGSCERGSRTGDSITSMAGLQLPGPGDYVLRIWLEDAAGNVDEQAASDAVHLRLDDRAPSASFDGTDAADPTRVAVSVVDEHSGLGGGEIELQRVGATQWRVLPTEVQASQLIARIPDQRLANGDYALRARVSDSAGNTALTDRRADGSPAHVVLPLRVVTRLRAGFRRTIRRRRQGRARVRKRTTLVSRARFSLGKKKVLRGRLTNRDGQPVADQSVEVFGLTRVAGATWEPLGVVTTGAKGRFIYRVRAARNRTIRIVYRGSPVIRPSSADVTVAVRARSTIEVSRRRVLNGGKVRFDGRILGRPLPPSGKLVELQAHYRGRWRTFTTPRADASGRWSYTYKFGATSGRITYPFRAVVPRQDLYPFARGRSRIVRVVVKGQ